MQRDCKDIPIGYDFTEVLEKGKRIYQAEGSFIVTSYLSSDHKKIWTAELESAASNFDDTSRYKYIKDLDEWIEIKK